MYNATAESYAAMMDTEIELPVYADVLGRLRERIEGLPGALVDAACGSGHMLSLFRDRFDGSRPLIGVDLSPRMVEVAAARLGPSARVAVGDMRRLDSVESGAAAAVVCFFAIHHLDPDGARTAASEWHRVLCSGGQLVLAAWEGAGAIDYGEEADIVALRYTAAALVSVLEEAGFEVQRCVVEPVDGFPMDAVYVEGGKR